MFRIAICGGEPYTANHIERLLQESGQVSAYQPILKFFNPSALIRYIEKIKGQLDIILFSIEPDQESDIEAAACIIRQFPHIKLILITGYIEYASTMMDARPVYFLTKPVEAEALAKAINAAQNALLREPSQCIRVNIRGYDIDLSVRDALYIQTSKRIVTLYGHSGQRIVHAKLKELADRLPPVFCYCHRDFIVNLDQVKSMDKKSFRLITGQRIPIGSTKYNKARMQFTDWREKDCADITPI